MINPDQANADGDGLGDLCDACPLDAANDFDDDGVCGNLDNCPFDPNSGQADLDEDGVGDPCDACPADPDDDIDGDFLCADVDNCPAVSNFDQADFDADGAGDACDADDDGDGVDDLDDCAALTPAVAAVPDPVGNSLRLGGGAATQLSWLRATQGPVSNVYRALKVGALPWDGTLSCVVPETVQTQSADGEVPPSGVAFLYLVSARNSCGESAAGHDSGGAPTLPTSLCAAANLDTDADGWRDLEDNCALQPNPAQGDSDQDFVGDDCDNCPSTYNPDQADTDGDMTGDACDPA